MWRLLSLRKLHVFHSYFNILQDARLDEYCIHLGYSNRQAWVNIVHLDQTPQNAASNLGLHCFSLMNPAFLYIQTVVKRTYSVFQFVVECHAPYFREKKRKEIKNNKIKLIIINKKINNNIHVIMRLWETAVDRRNHYENTPIQIHWKFYHQKMAIFQIKNCDIFHISAQNIDCWYSLEPPRGGSNEYPQPMFLSRNKKNNVYPCKPRFYYIRVGFEGVKII